MDKQSRDIKTTLRAMKRVCRDRLYFIRLSILMLKISCRCYCRYINLTFYNIYDRDVQFNQMNSTVILRHSWKVFFVYKI